MRGLGVIFCALVLILAPPPAHAQSLDRILGVITGVTAYGYNSCSYVSGDLGKAACQANRALNVVNTFRNSQLQDDYRNRQRFERRSQQLAALQRACRAGDVLSCQRSGGVDEKQMEVARALMDACAAGDRLSCRRADQIMADRSFYDADRR